MGFTRMTQICLLYLSHFIENEGTPCMSTWRIWAQFDVVPFWIIFRISLYLSRCTCLLFKSKNFLSLDFLTPWMSLMVSKESRTLHSAFSMQPAKLLLVFEHNGYDFVGLTPPQQPHILHHSSEDWDSKAFFFMRTGNELNSLNDWHPVYLLFRSIQKLIKGKPPTSSLCNLPLLTTSQSPNMLYLFIRSFKGSHSSTT
jgi:hypothetical protein